MKKSDFVYEEDFIISAECEECGHYTEDENDFDNGCPDCGGNLINSTSHEEMRCAICNGHVDMWEDVYRSTEDSDVVICTSCYEDLEED